MLLNCDYIFDSRCSWIHYAYMFCFLTVRCWAQPEELPVVVLGSFVFKEPVEPSQFGALQLFLKCTGHLKPTVWNKKQYCKGRLLATWEFSRYDGWNCHRNLQESYILRGSGFNDIFSWRIWWAYCCLDGLVQPPSRLKTINGQQTVHWWPQ